MFSLSNISLDQRKFTANRVLRGGGTAASFALFAVGGLLLGVLVFPLLYLLLRDPDYRRRKARSITSSACLLFVRFMHAVGVLEYQIDSLPDEEQLSGCVIVANHPSLIDVLFLIACFPQADCVVKGSIWSNLVTRWAARAADYIPNHDAADVLARCEQRLRMGRHLILFPESTRTAPYAMPLFKRGAAVLALRVGARCLPLTIHCEPRTLTKGEPWYHIPTQKVSFRLQVHPFVQRSDLIDDTVLPLAAAAERKLSFQLNGYLQGVVSKPLGLALPN